MDNKRGNKQNSSADFEVLQESVLGLALVFGIALITGTRSVLKVE